MKVNHLRIRPQIPLINSENLEQKIKRLFSDEVNDQELDIGDGLSQFSKETPEKERSESGRTDERIWTV